MQHWQKSVTATDIQWEDSVIKIKNTSSNYMRSDSECVTFYYIYMSFTPL